MLALHLKVRDHTKSNFKFLRYNNKIAMVAFTSLVQYGLDEFQGPSQSRGHYNLNVKLVSSLFDTVWVSMM